MHARSVLVEWVTIRSLLNVLSRRLHVVAALALAALLTVSCGGDGSTGPTSGDRAKFVGTWAGSYTCPGGAPTSDTLAISLGGSPLGFDIIIHVEAANPDTVFGELTEPNLIRVPQQSMGGAPGTAQIRSQGALVTYSQTGFGITCGGADYAKVP